MKRLLLPLLLLVLCGTAVVGCGQKGPLYHPDQTDQRDHRHDEFGF